MQLRYCFVFVPLFLSGSVFAAVHGVTPAEMAQVPEYCHYTQGFRDEPGVQNKTENVAYWTSVLGNAFDGMHHYCLGMIQAMRAQDYKMTPQRRDYWLSEAVSNFDYSIRHSPPDHVLAPEMHTKRARALVKLKMPTKAAEGFMKAISLKPDYWPPYADLSDLYKANGDRTKAKSILEEGLKNNPGSKTLESRMKALGENR